MIFQYTQYIDYIKQIKKQGPFLLFKDLSKDAYGFLLRHDVDFDLALAERLATIEFEQGASSTYFVLMSCLTYNVMCKENRRRIKKIMEMGHEIGLHFDPTLYPDDIQTGFEIEIATLSSVCGIKIQSVSLHNPSVHGLYPLFDGYINAYDPVIFSDYIYLSDSMKNFRGKEPYAFLNRFDGKNVLQILLHPLHYSTNGDAYDKVLSHAFARYLGEVHMTFLSNAAYLAEVGEDYLARFNKIIQLNKEGCL